MNYHERTFTKNFREAKAEYCPQGRKIAPFSKCGSRVPFLRGDHSQTVGLRAQCWRASGAQVAIRRGSCTPQPTLRDFNQISRPAHTTTLSHQLYGEQSIKRSLRRRPRSILNHISKHRTLPLGWSNPATLPPAENAGESLPIIR